MKEENKNRKTWCGFRPSIMTMKKKNKKKERKENKQLCRDTMKGDKE